jgi:ATP-binding cassette, subfamily B, multidrug efflux pump
MHGPHDSYHTEDTVLGKVYDRALMKRLFTYARPHYPRLFLCLFLVLLSTACALAIPRLMGLIIDKGITPRDTHVFKVLALVYLGVILAQWLLGFVTAYILAYLGQRIMYDIRMQVFSHLQTMSLRFFDKNPVGRLVTRVTNDITALSEMFSVGLVTVFSDFITIIGLVIMMYVLNARLALLVSGVALFLLPITFFFKARIRNAYRDIREKLARINAYLQEHISGIRVSLLFNRQSKNIKQFNVLNEAHFKAEYRSIVYYGLFVPSVTVLSSVAMGLAIYYGGGEVVQQTIALGVLVTFFNYIIHFFNPIQDLADKYTIFQAAMASSERVFKILDTPPEIADVAQPIQLKDFKGEIRFEHVWFAYDEGTNGPNYVLKDVSFTIAPGERVALVGITGSGKSTIINLLARFYDIQQGRILIDGVDIRQIAQAELRKLMSVVLQDVFLFSGNILDNIRMGEKNISLEQAETISRFVNAHNFIERLPGKYEAPVAERGQTLSSGQRQLLSFARALVFDPKILILDEATSSVDVETEHYIQDAINKLIKGKTSIIIAHRLSTIQNVDRIMVLHKGELKENGRHEKLMAQQGLYYKLYQLQFQKAV